MRTFLIDPRKCQRLPTTQAAEPERNTMKLWPSRIQSNYRSKHRRMGTLWLGEGGRGVDLPYTPIESKTCVDAALSRPTGIRMR